jgi:hypothetical protein
VNQAMRHRVEVAVDVDVVIDVKCGRPHLTSSVAFFLMWPSMMRRTAEGRAFFARRSGARWLGSTRRVVRRDGGQKMPWTKPLNRRSAMGIEWRAI